MKKEVEKVQISVRIERATDRRLELMGTAFGKSKGEIVNELIEKEWTVRGEEIRAKLGSEVLELGNQTAGVVQ